MRSSKITYNLGFLVGFFIFLGGIILKMLNAYSSDYIFYKTGSVDSGFIDGNGSMLIGGLVIFFSSLMYIQYKVDLKQQQLKKMEEINLEKIKEQKGKEKKINEWYKKRFQK